MLTNQLSHEYYLCSACRAQNPALWRYSQTRACQITHEADQRRASGVLWTTTTIMILPQTGVDFDFDWKRMQCNLQRLNKPGQTWADCWGRARGTAIPINRHHSSERRKFRPRVKSYRCRFGLRIPARASRMLLTSQPSPRVSVPLFPRKRLWRRKLPNQSSNPPIDPRPRRA